MFTGIIESMGQVRETSTSGTNKSFWISSPISSLLKTDQSVSHDGVCLTVEDVQGDIHKVTAVSETLQKTNLASWHPGRQVNLERSLIPGSRLDGHFVQGHADATGTCRNILNKNGSYIMEFKFQKKFAELVIEKGSISINGISLTAFDVGKNSFAVAVIPYTYEHTNLQFLKEKEEVNLEFDMIGKYILRKLSLRE